MREFPKKYDHLASEAKWMKGWEEQSVYRWDEAVPRENTFVVDTPPPTVSGALHVGHVFSYTHTDIVVRYHRMQGKNIMYPMGWDDNGLPTERRVQNKFAITCNPHLAYDESWKPAQASAKQKSVEVSRKNFIEACAVVTEEDEAAFETLWRRLGLSVDWHEQYATIDDHCRSISQASFLDLVRQELVYNSESPTMWDVGFQTALAQADLEDRERDGAFHNIRFGVEGGGELTIATTRPELLPACIAVVAHPDDERYKDLFGKNAITPLFESVVPIKASEHADPEKGSGILMICTFGDGADVDWWKPSGLPIRQVVGRNGRMLPVTFGEEPFSSQNPERANKAYAELVGKNVKQAKRHIAEMLAADDSAVGGEGRALLGDPEPTKQMVKFYEKGEQPIEFITTRQWFVKILDYKEELLEQGAKIDWHPSHMRSRYDHWVAGLNHDWCISRQRFFGVPFPVWYPLGEDGEPNYDAPIYASVESLPIDPLVDSPPGYSEDQRGAPGGFMGDPDVMDTWATSSLTPQIASHWGKDDARHTKLFPMDVRPQSHEIIRTWAFYTIVKAWMHEKEVPWRNVVISGWILDPDRKKMSKSRGNTVTPQHLLEEYSADAVRYWAGRARLGVDTAYDDKVFKTGRKLVTKIFNASKFVLMQLEDHKDLSSADISMPLDQAFARELVSVIEQASDAFERFDYAAALQAAETSFWYFCDNFIELVKTRAYQGEDESARRSAAATLEWALGAYLRLLAPVMPYVTEEVWSWYFAERRGEPSIHRATWPTKDEVSEALPSESSHLVEMGVEILDRIRQAKSDAQVSLKTPVAALRIEGEAEALEGLKQVLPDVLLAGKVVADGVSLNTGAKPEDGRFSVAIELGALDS